MGLTGVLATLIAFELGIGSRAELDALDLRLLHVSPLAASEELLYVDIDDRSIDELGRWPWPREILAGAISTLAECGAESIVLDVLLLEPQQMRFVSTGSVTGGTFGDDAPTPRRPVLDDALLAQTIREAGCVILPVAIREGDMPAAPLLRRMKAALVDDLSMTASDLAAELDVAGPRVEPLFAHAREMAVRERVATVLSRSPELDLESVSQDVLGPLEAGRAGPGHMLVQNEFLRQRGQMAARRYATSLQDPDVTSSARELLAPLAPFVAGAVGCGYVTFESDADKVLRHTTLVEETARGRFAQLAMVAAARRLRRGQEPACTPERLEDAVALTCGGTNQRVVPLDGRGRMLIRWCTESWPPGELRHISMAAVAAVWQEGRKLRKNEELAHALRLRVLSLGRSMPSDEECRSLYWQLQEALEQHDRAFRTALTVKQRAWAASLYGTPEDAQNDELTAATMRERKADALCRQVSRRLLDRLIEKAELQTFLQPPVVDGQDPEPGADERRRRAEAPQATLEEASRHLALLGEIPEENRRIRANAEELRAELAERVGGRICLVGSTSTGAADFVATPLDANTPGVVVHGNILQTLLDGRFIRKAPGWADALAIALCGAAAALVAALLPIPYAALVAIALGTGYAALNAWGFFGGLGIWLVLVGPLVAVAAGFVVVTAYRQVTEERGKREIRRMFSKALSPVLVDRLLDDPEMARLGGHRRSLTCLFSDLAGFTPLSARLGPQGTVRVLNRYFDLVAEIVQGRHGGYLNKFLGDGVLAFFGAPVEQHDHAARAIRAAVEYQARLQALNAELQSEYGGEVALSVRIGIATGEAMVGNCGSSRRMDYTAIGDCVNLASRLESAGKFFHARILVSEATWEAAADDSLLARAVGRACLAGVPQPVSVREVLGLRAGATETQLLQSEKLACALKQMAERDFEKASMTLQEILAAAPDDRPAAIYLDACRQALHHGAEPSWRPACPGVASVTGLIWPWESAALTESRAGVDG